MRVLTQTCGYTDGLNSVSIETTAEIEGLVFKASVKCGLNARKSSAVYSVFSPNALTWNQVLTINPDEWRSMAPDIICSKNYAQLETFLTGMARNGIEKSHKVVSTALGN